MNNLPDQDNLSDHFRAREIGRHRLRVAEIKRQAHHWRLTDCDEATLARMRHALIEEMETAEQRLHAEDRRFLSFIEKGLPLQTGRSLQAIDRVASEWEALYDHLQELDEALLVRHLRTRLADVLGGPRRVYLLDSLVLISILAVVSLTLADLFLVLPPWLAAAFSLGDTIISFFLMADFFLRLGLSEDKGWYFRTYWIDLLASIPFHEFARIGALVPVARLARLIRLLRLGRALRVALFAFRSLDKLFQTFQLNLLKRALFIAIALLFFGAISISAIEGASTTALSSLDESMWWSFTTAVTGGFADLYNPATLSGRLVTVGLVLLGLTVTGIFTASLTTVLVEDESSRVEQNQRNLELQLGVLDHKLDYLSGRANEDLIVLENVAQALSNRKTPEDVAEVLVSAMVENFKGKQAAVYALDRSRSRLRRIAVDAKPDARGIQPGPPPENLYLDNNLAGRVVEALLQHADVASIDLEPEAEPAQDGKGIEIVCPLVANGQVMGVLYAVLPEELGRFYVYNRVPMTMAHHGALALSTTGLNSNDDVHE